MNGNCGVCIRACRLGHSFCGRRDAHGNLIAANSYHAILIDSLFDKPILHFLENRRILSIGSWGCNLRCPGCQNARLSWTGSGEGLNGVEMAPNDVINLALEKKCRGICYTFNEPAILLESIDEVASKARDAGLANIFVTNSTLTRSSIKRIVPLLDAVAADIKSLDDSFYRQYCGAEGIPDVTLKILDCIRAFHDAGCHLEVRTNVIPNANDQDQNFVAIASWIKKVLGENIPWHVTRFFPAHQLSHLSLTPAATILRAQRIGRQIGLKQVHAFLSKGCDCAKETGLLDRGNVTHVALPPACCPQS